jgi:glycerol kinase
MGIPRAILPRIRPSGADYGQVQAWSMPITAVCADPQAGLFGQACFGPGVVKVTYGRDALALVDIGVAPLDTAGQLRTAAVAVLEREPPRFALEGRILAAGLVLEWLRDELALIPTAADSELVAQQAPSSGGVYVVPAFLGLGAPYWNTQVRGGVFGLTPKTTRAQFVRAALEGVAYRVADVVAAMTHWTGQRVTEVRADGGAAANNLLMQFQADLLDVPVRRNRLTSAAAPGAAYLAGLQAGLWNSREEVAALWPEDRCFEPALNEPSRQALYQGWSEAIRRLIAR